MSHTTPDSANRQPRRGEPRARRLLIAVIVVVVALIAYGTVRTLQQAQINSQVRGVAQKEIRSLGDADLMEINVVPEASPMVIYLTIRAAEQPDAARLASLQQAIADDLGRPVSLKLNIIVGEPPRPAGLPTPTRTPTVTVTPTFVLTPTLASTPTPR